MRVHWWQSLQHLWTSMSKSLQTKFVVVIVVVQFTVMGLVTFVVEKRQQAIIMQESQGRAQTLAANLAALSEVYLLSYNFIKLVQLAEKTAAEQDVAYAIIHLHNGQVAASSGHPEKQGSTLTDAISRQALLADQLLVQEITTGTSVGEDTTWPCRSLPREGRASGARCVLVFRSGEPCTKSARPATTSSSLA